MAEKAKKARKWLILDDTPKSGKNKIQKTNAYGRKGIIGKMSKITKVFKPKFERPQTRGFKSKETELKLNNANKKLWEMVMVLKIDLEGSKKKKPCSQLNVSWINQIIMLSWLTQTHQNLFSLNGVIFLF